MSTTTQTSAASGVEPPDLAYVDSLLAALPAADVVVNDAATALTSSAAEPSVTATTLAFPAQCLLRDAVEWKPQLQQLAMNAVLTLDVSAVEKVDAAFLQLLVALSKQRQQSGQSAVLWQGTSKVLAEGAAVLGLQACLQLPEAA